MINITNKNREKVSRKERINKETKYPIINVKQNSSLT